VNKMVSQIIEPRIIFLARLTMNKICDTEIVEWAYNELLLGSDTPSLRILAGLDNPIDPVDVQNYLRKSLKELSIVIEKKVAIDEYVKLLANKTIAGEITKKEMSEKMYQVLVYTEYDKEFFVWFNINEYYDDYWMVSKRNIEDVVIEECKKILSTT
jgi:hypothetical protein